MGETASAEAIEEAGLRAWHAVASARGVRGCDWRLERIGDALCSVSASEPSILINRVLGLGSEGALSLERLEEIKSLYRDAGVGRYFLHVLPNVVADPESRATLRAAGFQRYRGWMKFVRRPGPVGTVETALTVRRIGPGEAAEFAAIVVPAFDLEPASQPIVAALADHPRWQLYMSFDGERPAGTGAVYLDGEDGSVDFGATHPQFRRRGSQSALLSRRVRDALEAGCERLVTMTGEAAPGDPQHSYHNILKAGFEEAYLRENWILAEGQ